jgi:hypothetical protein
MCSDDHIFVVAIANVSGINQDALRQLRLALETEPMYELLHKVNVLRSMNAQAMLDRYGDDDQSTKLTKADISLERLARLEKYLSNPAQVCKLISSYEYQACDSRTWADSEASAISHVALKMAVSSLPKYSAASWSI